MAGPNSQVLFAGSPFAALRVRNFRLHFAGQVVSNVGTWFQSIAQALLVIELTGSGKALGAVTALYFTPMLLLGVHAGVVADRVKPRTLLITTASLAALLAATLAVVTAARHVDIWWVLGLALGLGCVQASIARRRRPSCTSWSARKTCPRPWVCIRITQSSARMIGPHWGGAATRCFGSAACFAITRPRTCS